ncbi:class I SAM-dependent methyltransferase [Nocardioides sp.]|uniref:class I SAM-dependent methyltransferase n=1 Tax=Nocardioides sp. TaxID=35761 RepID=UPI0039E6453A
MTDPSRSFGKVADAYDRGRPSYPREAVEWLVGAGPKQVLELGAGTGKLTRTLVELGHEVFATDPDDAMLDVLSRNLPEVRATAGTAEQIPAPDQSFDVVIAGQAYHWFDPETALPEIARVLKEGGVLGLVWNQRDESIPWVRKLGGIIGKHVENVDPTHDLESSGFFATPVAETFKFWQQIDQHSVVDLVLSRSVNLDLSEEEVAAKRAATLAFYEDYGRGMDGMKLPYLTYVYRALVTDRPARPAMPTTLVSTTSSEGGDDTAVRLPRVLDGDDPGTDELIFSFR